MTSPLTWVRDNVAHLDKAYGVYASPEHNTVTVYGHRNHLAMLRLHIEAKPATDGDRVRTWVRDIDGMQVHLVEVGVRS